MPGAKIVWYFQYGEPAKAGKPFAIVYPFPTAKMKVLIAGTLPSVTTRLASPGTATCLPAMSSIMVFWGDCEFFSSACRTDGKSRHMAIIRNIGVFFIVLISRI
ncbi:MAG: hypothetical protein A4E63_01897 [Syntrophorhabdus sp. PtaU1.Bin050]|nr:MAG: hypothetical protein A4E63_01897 [Syntrophorhabdus sp. PtaU1.Bin050]